MATSTGIPVVQPLIILTMINVRKGSWSGSTKLQPLLLESTESGRSRARLWPETFDLIRHVYFKSPSNLPSGCRTSSAYCSFL